jgi:predicted HicB family RNase H-like nuclease
MPARRPSDSLRYIRVRVAPEFKEFLQEQAKQHDISLNAEIARRPEMTAGAANQALVAQAPTFRKVIKTQAAAGAAA